MLWSLCTPPNQLNAIQLWLLALLGIAVLATGVSPVPVEASKGLLKLISYLGVYALMTKLLQVFGIMADFGRITHLVSCFSRITQRMLLNSRMQRMKSDANQSYMIDPAACAHMDPHYPVRNEAHLEERLKEEGAEKARERKLLAGPSLKWAMHDAEFRRQRDVYRERARRARVRASRRRAPGGEYRSGYTWSRSAPGASPRVPVVVAEMFVVVGPSEGRVGPGRRVALKRDRERQDRSRAPRPSSGRRLRSPSAGSSAASTPDSCARPPC